MSLARLKKLGLGYCRRETTRRKMRIRDGWTDWRHRRTDERNVVKRRLAHKAYRKARRLEAKGAA